MAINKVGIPTYGPFKLWTIQNFPFIEEDFDAITNYQLYSKIVEFCKKVAENQNILDFKYNELIDAFNELENYVNNYFENLDVQEEINNKLDEMAESGQLADIIAQYLDLASVLAFNTIEELHNAINVNNGSICYVLGENSYNDGNGSYYKVRPITSDDTIDGYHIVSIVNDNTIIAERMYNKNLYVTPEMFGCIGDGITDDTINFQACITYAKTNNMKIKSSTDKTYLINDTLDVSNLYIDLNHATIKAGSSIVMMEVDTNTGYTNIENIIFDCNDTASCGLKLTESRRSKFNNLDFINVHTIGCEILSTGESYENMFDNINMQSTITNTSSIGFKIGRADNHFTNICMTNIVTAFELLAGGNIFDKVHCWIGDTSLINGSTMFKININYESNIQMNFIYSDTYQKTFDYVTNSTQYLYIENLNVQYNQAIYTDACNDSYIFNCLTDNQINYIKLVDGFLTGLNSSEISTYFTNRTKAFTKLVNTTTSRVNYTNKFSLSNVNANLTVEKNIVYYNYDTVTINFIASFNSAGGSGSYIQFVPVGTLDYYTAPLDAITSQCQIATSRWDFYNVQNGYLYIDNNNYQVQARVPRNNAGTNYLFINITYKNHQI